MVGGGSWRFGRGRARLDPGACSGLNPGKTGRVRASDERREETVAALRECALDGCLTLDTFAGRVDAAYRAKTIEELEVLVADLPRPDGWRAATRRALARLVPHAQLPPQPPPEIEGRLPPRAAGRPGGRRPPGGRGGG